MASFSIEKELGPNGKILLNLCSVQLILDSFMIGWIVLNRKDKSVNVMDQVFIEDLEKVLDFVEKNLNQFKMVLLYSEKSSGFFVGADVEMLYQITKTEDGIKAASEGQRVLQRLDDLGKKLPTIACINGVALGGGLELALACKFRWCSDVSSIQLGLPEVKLGVIPGAGGTVRLPKLIGLQEAMKIILAGASVRPAKGKKLGIVDRLFEGAPEFPGDHRFFNNVRRYAASMIDKKFPERPVRATSYLEDFWLGRQVIKRMATQNLDKQTKKKFPAPYAALESMLYAYPSSVVDGTKKEAELFGKMATTQTSKNLLSIFFLQEGSKKLLSRIGALPRPVDHVSVIGAGVMGSGIAQLNAAKRIPTYMKDIKEEFVNKGLEFVKSEFTKKVERGRLSPEKAKQFISYVSGGTDYARLRESQVIIEAAVEVMKIKKLILKDCEANSNADAIFATNTSTLSITELATVSERPQNVIGMHYFNPVARMPLIEIIKGEKTSAESVATIYQLSLRLGKVPIVCNDGPGFIVNRILGAFLLEATRLLEEQVNIEFIDSILLDFGMPMGAFRLFDEVGLDVASHSGDTLKVLGERFHTSEKGQKGMKSMIDNKMLGKKTGSGFYVYQNGKKSGVNPKLKKLLGYNHSGSKQIKKKAIINRCILLMVNEAAFILQEKIAERPEDVDVGTIFGLGFAFHRGGLLSYADLRGIPNIVKSLKKMSKKISPRFQPCSLLESMAENNLKFFPKRVYLDSKM